MTVPDPESDSNCQGVDLQLFNTDVSSICTVVYANVRLPNADEFRLSGVIRGPFSASAQTLPTTFQFSDLGRGKTLLARAYIADPCPWSRQLPANYRVELQVRCGDKIAHELKAEFGIRDTHAVGASLRMNGKRTVLRGVGLGQVESSSNEESHATEKWREHGAVMLVDEPDDSLCRNASAQGVILCARLSGADRLGQRLRRVSAYPGVHIVWIDKTPMDATLRQFNLNVLLAANVNAPENWEHADVIVWEVGDTIDDVPLSIDKPVIVLRRLSERTSLPDARAACDQLQRDLAPRYNLAGYFV